MAGDVTHSVLGYLALNLCTVIWGTQHAVAKSLVSETELPMLVNAIRFSIAALVTLVVRSVFWCAYPASSQPASRTGRCGLIIGAAELAVWQTAGFTLQLVGLRWTTAQRSAFLLYLNATIVPVIATLLGEQGIGLRTWACVLVAVAGTLLLVHDGGAPNVGDLWSLGAACASAMFIVRLTHAGRGRNAAMLSAWTLAFTSVCCWALAAIAAAHAGVDLAEGVASLMREHALPLLYLSVCVSAFASYLQAAGQQSVPPHHAVVIYTLDPVYGALFAWILLGEQLHGLGWLGVGLVVLANLMRRLPWERLIGTRAYRALVTPLPSETHLAGLAHFPRDVKRQPLLGTPKTPAWLQQAWSRHWGREDAPRMLEDAMCR